MNAEPESKSTSVTRDESHEDFVARAGIEPATHGFSVHCSTD